MESNLSSLIAAAETGESTATEVWFSSLYAEMHGTAKRELAGRGGPATLSVTTLLHEAYLDMASRDDAQFPARARFMGYAARVMRGLIIDHARNRQAQKRGGQFEINPSKTRTPATPPMNANCNGSAMLSMNWPRSTANWPNSWI